MDAATARKLLEANRENYDSFAASFSQTRGYVPREITGLMAGLSKKGQRVLDIGCGNGRFYPFFEEQGAEYSGIDNSGKLVSIARDKHPEANFSVADALSLPFADNNFDFINSVAVLHHIPSKNCRREFFNEAKRVLKPGGLMLVTVWDLRFNTLLRAKRWKRLKSFLISQAKIFLGIAKMDSGDFFISWQNEYPRYVHGFTLRELRSLAVSAGFKIEKAGVLNLPSREGNLYIIAKKLHN